LYVNGNEQFGVITTKVN